MCSTHLAGKNFDLLWFGFIRVWVNEEFYGYKRIAADLPVKEKIAESPNQPAEPAENATGLPTPNGCGEAG